MKLINTSQQHPDLIKTQLETTDAFLVEVYSVGNTDVVFSQAPSHYEILISNKYRSINYKELDKIRDFFFARKIDNKIILMEQAKTVFTSTLIEISIPIKQA